MVRFAWLFLAVCMQSATAADYKNDDWRRTNLKDFASASFTNSTNHCKTFADVSDHAAKNVKQANGDVGMFLEDMRLVIIGADTFLRRKGERGKYYMAVKTNASGFKDELVDDSPQVEHAYAGIYFAKGVGMAPGAVGLVGSGIELIQDILNQKLTVADKLLYAYSSDIGSRLSNDNFEIIKTPILRTLCK